MHLPAGARLGHYVISGALGAGGMGEVYRARDTKLDRDVAIKVLPALLAGDPERRARFEREARLLASLNHPHIGAIHGIEHTGDAPALILELVEGETIADLLRAGPMPIDMALRAATQIASALDAAHERGIVHRDLKPANIKITPDGVVKVLDFGLAKALAPEPDSNSDRQLAESPTVTVAGTREGIILGTAAYMSPEQARGRAIDRRTDIWAFGCVLYEMLTGRRAFEGETVSDTIAAILAREPDWSLLPAATPPGVNRLLRRCLERDAKRRLRDIGDLSIDLEAPAASGTTPPVTNGRWRVATMAAALIALLAVAFAGWQAARPAPAPALPSRFSFSPPEGHTLMPGSVAVSPDGRRIVFGAESASGARALWLRRLDAETAQRIAGTEGLSGGPPAWSPDGQFIAFLADNLLKRVELESGAVLTIAPMQTNMGITWNADNVIVYGPVNRTALHRVPAGGGTAEPITTLDTSRENSHRWPQFLPGGRHFLFTARSDVRENNLIRVGALDSTETQPIRPAQSNAVYVSPGYLLFAEEGTLMAQQFDARTWSLTGDAVPLVAGVAHNTPSSDANFDASADGSVLVYVPQSSRLSRLTWFDRRGNELGTLGPERDFTGFRLSPDGSAVATAIPDPLNGNRDIWIVDTANGALRRLTSHAANDWWPVWSPDGARIAFSTDRDGTSSVYEVPSTGGAERLVARGPDGLFLRDWSRDGQRLIALIARIAPVLGNDLVAVPVSGGGQPVPYFETTARETDGALSPDMDWLAFDSNESGVSEVYVMNVDTTRSRRVSADGGRSPRWRSDGRELFYVAPNGDLMAVAVTEQETLTTAMPVRMFRVCGDGPPALDDPNVEVAPDGQRFLTVCATPGSLSTTISVVLNPTLPPR